MHHLQRLPNVLPLGEVLNTLRNGRNHSSTQDTAGDQPTHRQQTGLDLPYPNNNRCHIGQGRQTAGTDTGKTADRALLDAVAIDAGGNALPFLSKAPACVIGANGLGTTDGVDQQTLPLIAA